MKRVASVAGSESGSYGYVCRFGAYDARRFLKEIQMRLSNVHGVALHPEDQLLIHRLAHVRRCGMGSAKRIGLLNHEGELYKIVFCDNVEEFDFALDELEALGFVRAIRQEAQMRVGLLYEKPQQK